MSKENWDAVNANWGIRVGKIEKLPTDPMSKLHHYEQGRKAFAKISNQLATEQATTARLRKALRDLVEAVAGNYDNDPDYVDLTAARELLKEFSDDSN